MEFDSDFILDRMNDGSNRGPANLRTYVESKLNELAQTYADDLQAKDDYELWDLVRALITQDVAGDCYLSRAHIQTMAATVIIRQLLRRHEVRELESSG